MNDIDQILPVTEVKRRFLELLKQVQEAGGNIVITKNGSPAGILLNMDEYEGLLETLELLSVPGMRKSIQEARADIRTGRTKSLKEIFG